ncbi:uncharacterized protein UBRO_21019 [Ustilago bromivora]|uniref:Uncharacterized protein n=1 Tax=Ustilago bromivora TaxID=307758 RepID=A0A1K0GD68_9BASI|nr:uncharacterized protein UBRO_21019 [Ustilago bromivora]
MGKGDGTIASYLLKLVHFNLSTHFSSQTEFTSVLVAIDDASSFTYVKPLCSKANTLHILQEWIKYAEIQTGHQLKTICSDNRGEWSSNIATHWQNEASFRWQKSSVYTTIPAIFMGYHEEDKGWKLLSPKHNPSVFWSNSVRFLEDQCWEDRTNTMPIKETNAIFYNDIADIEDLSYSKEDEFDEELTQPLEDIYHPPSEEDLALEGDLFLPEPSEISPQNLLCNQNYQQFHQKWLQMDSLRNCGLLVDLLDPIYQAKAQLTSTALQPTVKQALNGFSQRSGIDYDKIFAPVVPQDAIHTILSIAARQDWELDSIDVTQAYLNASLHHEVYLKPPKGADIPKGKVYKLIKGLYGLKQSGCKWNLELDAHLQSMGFLSLSCAPCIYLRGTGETKVIIAIYVDDMLITGPKQSIINAVKTAITDKWKITDNGPAKEFLKIKVTCHHQQLTISLDQQAYIEGIIKEWLPNGGKSWSPMDASPTMMPPDFVPPEDVKQQYPSLVGKLMWVSNTVRPDICFTVNTLAQHISRPSPDTMQVALKVIKYLNQTKDEVFSLGNEKANTPPPPIVTYTDANWASNPNTDRRSTSGSVTMVFGSLVGWKSHVQKCVSLSAVEDEFMAASEATREALFYRYLL